MQINFEEILEKEHDAEATRFEEDNEIHMYKMNLKGNKNLLNYENEQFYGIANGETKFLEKKELSLDDRNKKKRKNLKKYELLQFAFG